LHAVQPCALRVCETVGSTPVAVPKPKAAQAFSPEPMKLHVRADWRGSSCRVISHAHTRWYPIQKQPPFSLGDGTASGGRKYPQDLPGFAEDGPRCNFHTPKMLRMKVQVYIL